MGTERPGNIGSGGGGSRFAYHGGGSGDDGDLPAEGGVRGVGGGGRTAGGVPGEGELLLDISELARTLGMRYTHRFHIPPYPADDMDAVAPLDGAITLTNTGALLLLRGAVETTLRLECGRCLARTEQPVRADLEEEFDLVTSRNAFQQDEVQAVDEDSPASVIRGNVLNLGELLRQNLLLAAPLQPLCREECPGLAPEDGEAATAEAGDATGAADSPLRHLAELLDAKRRSGDDGGTDDATAAKDTNDES